MVRGAGQGRHGVKDLLVTAIPTKSDFTSRLRGPVVASRVGVLLGICFAVAFLTGVWSHYLQDQPTWLTLPTRPVWLYRVIQGLHVIAGTAAVPLLLVKLWSVYHNLFAAVPWRMTRQLVVHLLERASIAALVASAIFQLVTGLVNITHWYPWAFSFRSTHYAVAWIAIGALVVHIAVKLPLIRESLAADIDDSADPVRESHGLSRRGLVRASMLAAGVAVLGTAGSTVPMLRSVSVFGVRSGNGPQGVPVNMSAQAAGVVSRALSPSYRLSVVGVSGTVTLSRDDLLAMQQHSEALPIACVEGWSATGVWTGVRMRDLLDLVDAPARSAIHVVSLQEAGAFADSEMPGEFTEDPLTLLALSLAGEPLSIDHGFPARLIAPARPGVLQTKWVTRIEVTS